MAAPMDDKWRSKLCSVPRPKLNSKTARTRKQSQSKSARKWNSNGNNPKIDQRDQIEKAERKRGRDSDDQIGCELRKIGNVATAHFCLLIREEKKGKKRKKSQFSCARLLLSPSLQLSSMTMSSLGDASFVHSGGGGWARGGGGGDGGGATRAAASLFNIFNIVPRCWPHAIHIEIIEIIWAPILSTPQILKTAKKKQKNKNPLPTPTPTPLPQK